MFTGGLGKVEKCPQCGTTGLSAIHVRYCPGKPLVTKRSEPDYNALQTAGRLLNTVEDAEWYNYADKTYRVELMPDRSVVRIVKMG